MGVHTSAESGLLPWSLQPMNIASRLGRGMWCGVSSPFWPLGVGKSGPWDQHHTPVIWAPITNADSQASPWWACIFTRSLGDSVLSLVWEALPWRKLFELLCHHHHHLLAGLCSGEHSDLWRGLYFMDLCTDWCCWGLLKFLKFLGSSPLERLTSFLCREVWWSRMGFFCFSSGHFAGSESTMLQGVVRISVGRLEVGSLSFKKFIVNLW